MKTVRISEIEPIAVAGGELQWRPLRRTLGIGAFGINAYTADAGHMVVEEHGRQGVRTRALAGATANPRQREHARTDTDLDSLRDDPRFTALVS